MITIGEITSAFRSMLGWPYATPGSNDANGVDCSGAFVYAYRLYRQSIYHGSNRIIRVYCNGAKRVTRAEDLEVGMAIFKSRTDLSNMKAEYKPGGRYYDPELPYDYYHVGLVTSVRPLEIINATPPEVLISRSLSGWSTAAYLNAVEYGDEPEPTGETAYTVAEQGGSVNLRAEPRAGAAIRARVPLGRRVTAYESLDGWRRVRYGAAEGYMMEEFLVTGCRRGGE